MRVAVGIPSWCEADSVAQLLTEMATAFEVPLYFVLGNHDFYRGSIAGVRDSVAKLCATSERLSLSSMI